MAVVLGLPPSSYMNTHTMDGMEDVWLWRCPSSSILFGSQRATKSDTCIKCVHISNSGQRTSKPRFPMTSRFFMLCLGHLNRQKKKKRDRYCASSSNTQVILCTIYSEIFPFYFYISLSGTNRRRGNNPSLIILDTPQTSFLYFVLFCFVL